MIYAIIVLVLGYAFWQIIKVVKNSKKGSCASGCSGCASSQVCSMQVVNLLQNQSEQAKQN